MENLSSGLIGAIVGSIVGAVITGFFAYTVSEYETSNRVKDKLKLILFNGIEIINYISKLDILGTDKAWEFDSLLLKFQYDLTVFIEDSEYSYVKDNLNELLSYVKQVHDFALEWISIIQKDYIEMVTGQLFDSTKDYSKYLNDDKYRSYLITHYPTIGSELNDAKAKYLKKNINIINELNKHTRFKAIFDEGLQNLSSFD